MGGRYLSSSVAVDSAGSVLLPGSDASQASFNRWKWVPCRVGFTYLCSGPWVGSSVLVRAPAMAWAIRSRKSNNEENGGGRCQLDLFVNLANKRCVFFYFLASSIIIQPNMLLFSTMALEKVAILRHHQMDHCNF
jgi:hypothetical protein